MTSQDSQKPQGLPNPYGLPKPTGSLPNPYAQGVVASAAPVRYTEEQAKAEQLRKAHAHNFHNPHNIKRPQPKQAGPAVKKPQMPVVSASVSTTAAAAAPASTTTQQHDIDYYRSTVEDDAAIIEERRMRQHAEKMRKKDQKKFQKQYGFWGPSAGHKSVRYSNLKAFNASGDWRGQKSEFDALVKHCKEASKSRKTGERSGSTPLASSSSPEPASVVAKPSFAPPTSYNTATASPPVDAQEEDPYVRRMRLSQQQHVPTPPPPPPPSTNTTAPPPPPTPASATSSSQSVFQNATISAPPVRYANATISAPPVRFERPDVAMSDADEPAVQERPAKRAKISKAEAMMAKMGYVKGQGLGKNNDGVVTSLQVKRRRVPQGASGLDEEGGKVKSQQVWDVSGGERHKADEPGKFGEESCVVAAWGCTDGVDWDENAQRNDGGIRQEIGEVFSEKFGPVEQVQLDETNEDGVVYVKFESILSALNAVNRCDEGFLFRDKKLRARYYDERKWKAGVWEH